jgi:hypothetical protein
LSTQTNVDVSRVVVARDRDSVLTEATFKKILTRDNRILSMRRGRR